MREIEIIDPLSPAVEIVRDAFGPGRDVEWLKDGVVEYLTADPLDADEAMLEAAEGTPPCDPLAARPLHARERRDGTHLLSRENQMIRS